MNRRTVGVELKESYYNQAASNCAVALTEPKIVDLEDEVEANEQKETVGEKCVQISMFDEQKGEV